MKSVWFVFSNEIVSGPYTAENIELGLTKGRWSTDSLIWWKGQREWITIKEWKENLPQIQEGFKSKVQRSTWYVEFLGVQKGPLSWIELKEFIMVTRNIAQVRMWTMGMKKWATVYEMPEVAKQLDITRREHPRAPIQGEAFVKRGAEDFVCHAAEIGEGGMGLKNVPHLIKGDVVYVTLKSPLLVNPIQSKATVVYTGKGGYTGLQFENLHAESRATIIDYVRQFSNAVDTSDVKAVA